MDVSIILVNYKTCDLLLNCIASVKKQSYGFEYEIIVVDNASGDNSKEVIKYKHPEVVYVESDVNLGFGKANNLGVSYASGDYVFFLNTDTLLVNNAVLIFLQYALTNNYNGALGTILEDNEGNNIHSYGKFLSLGGELKDVISKYLRFMKDKSILHPQSISSPFNVEYITGADLFMPRSLFNTMNGFDPDYFMYSEECDLQYRMSKNRYQRTIIPGPRIIHFEGGSDNSNVKHWSYSRFYNMNEGKMIYIGKHFTLFSIFMFHIIDFIFLTPIVIMSSYSSKQKYALVKLLALGKSKM